MFTVGQVVCRPTQKEAEDYYHYAIIEMADWGSVDRMMEIKNITPQTLGEKEYAEKRFYFASRAIGGYPFVGSPDRVAEELADLSRGGMRGIALLDRSIISTSCRCSATRCCRGWSGSACASRRGSSAEFLLEGGGVSQLLHIVAKFCWWPRSAGGRPRRQRAALLGLQTIAFDLGLRPNLTWMISALGVSSFHSLCRRRNRAIVRLCFNSSARWLIPAEHAARPIN